MNLWIVQWIPLGSDFWRKLYCGNRERAEAEVAKLKASAEILQCVFAKEPRIDEVDILP